MVKAHKKNNPVQEGEKQMENQAKMKKNFLVILLLILTLSAFAQQKKVAVYVTGQQSGVGKVLGDQLVSAFAKSGKYIAVERTASFLAELSKEISYQQSGAVNDQEIARLGQGFGVQYVCVAEMSDVFGEKYISARLIDVETAEIVNTHYVSGAMNNMNDCLNMAIEIANNLTKGTFTEQKEERLLQEENLKKEKEASEKKLMEEGYVDLGLPSGTWWKQNDEEGTYQYYEAIERFGEDLPTKKQCEELINFCKWSFTTQSLPKDSSEFKYKLIAIAKGPNGNKIEFIMYFRSWGFYASYWTQSKGIVNHERVYYRMYFVHTGRFFVGGTENQRNKYGVRLARIVK